jgi:hypothetical protein
MGMLACSRAIVQPSHLSGFYGSFSIRTRSASSIGSIMFEQAAQQHFEWHCQVGGISSDENGLCTGMGCFLAANIILSAAHVWESIRNRYEYPLVMHSSGGYRCEVLREWLDWDVIVLRTVHQIQGTDTANKARAAFPPLSKERMYLGREVGMFSRLTTINEQGGRQSQSLFTSSRVSSVQLPKSEKEKLTYGLSNTVVQRGFSGSAVFLQDGSVVGVLVQFISFPIDLENLSWGRYVLPLVSPVYEIRDQIAELLAQEHSVNHLKARI